MTITTPGLALLAGALALWPAGGYGQADTPPPPTITVVGHGETAAPPDLVRLTFAVEITAQTAEGAARGNAERAARVVAAAKRRIGSEGTVSTGGYQLIPMYADAAEPAHRGDPKPVLVGYRSENTVVVELGDPGRAGAIIDEMLKEGANRVAGVEFDVRDGAAATAQALAAAGRDARRQADALAAALGVKLGAIQSASAAPEPIHRPYETFATTARMAAVETPIEPGKVSVRATVEVRYRIVE
jgi:hypothetical protein